MCPVIKRRAVPDVFIVLQYNGVEEGFAVDFSDLVSLVRHEKYWRTSAQRTAANVYSWELYTPASEPVPGKVFLCPARQLPETVPEGSCFLCTGAEGADWTASSYENAHVVFVDGDLESLQRRVSHIMDLDHRLHSDMQILFDAMNSGKGLQHLVDAAYSLFKGPVVVIDSAFKILAEQIADNEFVRFFEEERRLGHYMDANIRSLKQQRVYERARERGYPLLTAKSNNSKKAWLVTLIYASGVEVAQLSIMEYDREFSFFDYELAYYLSKLISLELQKRDLYKHNQMFMHSALMADLLAGNISDDTAAVRARQLSWKLSDCMYLMSISSRFYDFSDQKAAYICSQIQDLLPDCRWIISEKELLFLIVKNGKDGPAGEEQFWAPLREYLEINKLTAAISDRFSCLTDVKWRRSQCDAALEYGMQIDADHRLFFYLDYALHHICSIALERFPMQVVCHPGVLKMRAHDINNHTNYLETVREYLRASDNPSAAAAELFIHKNTLFYRLNRAKELFGLDLSDSCERMRIYLAILSIDLSSAD